MSLVQPKQGMMLVISLLVICSGLLLVLAITSTLWTQKHVPDPQVVQHTQKLVHFVTMANPLHPVAIVAVDSVARHIPGATIKLHVVMPEGANETLVEVVKTRFEDQLIRFMDHPDVDLQIVMHPNIQDELVGTPLEKYKIPQEHFGGLLQKFYSPQMNGGDRDGTPFGSATNALVHSSDLLRLIFVWREGGLYLDTDYLLMDNIWPLVEAASSFVICETLLHGGHCRPCNGIFASVKAHPFLWDLLKEVSFFVERQGINSVWPLRPPGPGEPRELHYTGIGPTLFLNTIHTKIWKREDIWTSSEEYARPSPYNLGQIRTRPQTWFRSFVWSNTAFPLYVLPARYFFPTNYTEHVLEAKFDTGSPALYRQVYGSHIGGKTTGTDQKLYLRYLFHITDKPESNLAFVHRSACWLYCDVNTL
eukprot:Lankesteria_metandrocarpae@DN5405_c0_g2_i10.p1